MLPFIIPGLTPKPRIPLVPSLLFGALAGAVAIVATVAIERLGGRIGGLIASIPSTIVPASLGFWWASAEIHMFQDALYAVPGGMLVNAAFLYCWKVFPDRLPPFGDRTLLGVVTALSLLAWAVLAVFLNHIMALDGISRAAVGTALFGVQIAAGCAAVWRGCPAPRGKASVSLSTLLARGLLAGLAIGVSIVIAGLDVPVIAGIASVFPAIFLTTMVSVWWSQGRSVPMGAVGPMVLGSNSVSAYALAAAWAIPSLGPGAGATAAWGAAIGLVSVPSWFLLRWRTRRTGKETGLGAIGSIE